MQIQLAIYSSHDTKLKFYANCRKCSYLSCRLPNANSIIDFISLIKSSTTESFVPVILKEGKTVVRYDQLRSFAFVIAFTFKFHSSYFRVIPAEGWFCRFSHRMVRAIITSFLELFPTVRRPNSNKLFVVINCFVVSGFECARPNFPGIYLFY